MHKEIFINVTQHEKRVAILDNKRLEEFYSERPDQVNLVGNIYKGRVESVLPGMGAAFVDLGLEKNGFLYVSDVVSGAASFEKLFEEGADEEYVAKMSKQKSYPSIAQLLKKGDEVVIQIVKEPISTKGARLTTHISIPGRFLVLMPFDNHIGLSKRIESREERDRIRKIMESLKLPKDLGFIVRTAAIGASEKDFQRESRYLINLWNQIRAKVKRSKPPALIHSEYDLILRVARDIFTADVSRLEVDSREDHRRISRFLSILAPHLRPRLKLYGERVPLFRGREADREDIRQGRAAQERRVSHIRPD
jgi:ribonuclease G